MADKELYEQLGRMESDIKWIKDILMAKSERRKTVIGWAMVVCVAVIMPIAMFTIHSVKNLDILVSLHKAAIEAVLSGTQK